MKGPIYTPATLDEKGYVKHAKFIDARLSLLRAELCTLVEARAPNAELTSAVQKIEALEAIRSNIY